MILFCLTPALMSSHTFSPTELTLDYMTVGVRQVCPLSPLLLHILENISIGGRPSENLHCADYIEWLAGASKQLY